jgi:serine protease Do
VISAGNQNATVESITVTMPDRTEYEATLVGKDPDSDLAVLKINARSDLPFVRFGDSEAARVGDWVIAIGNPFGLGGTVTTGIVSAINRNTGQGGAYDSFIQTDASINSGNSGGPMFDLNGNVIGINNAIISPTGGNVGIGFAIPAEVAAPIVAKLRAGQSIERGYLGVQISPMNEDLADSLGVDKNRGEFVERVEPGEAAEKAGLKAGDVVVKVNGLDVTPDRNLSSIVANAGVGQNVPIELIRDGKRIKLNAVLGRRPSQEEFAQRFNEEAQEDFSDQDETMNAQAAQKALGLAVANITPNIARQIGVPSGQQGVVVLAVDPNSDVAQKGIRRGDVLTSINRRPVSKPEDVEAVVSEAQKSGRDAVLLQVKRRTADPRFVPVRLKEG